MSHVPLTIHGVLMTIVLCVGCVPEKRAADGPRDSGVPAPASAPIGRSHFTYPLISAATQPSAEPRDRDLWFEFQSKSPGEFLEHAAGNSHSGDIFERTLVFHNIHRGWVRHEDLPALLARFEDDSPASSLMLETCSFFPSKALTVGDHAALLVQGYRAEFECTGYGGYPPVLSSDGCDDKESLATWAREHLRR